MKDVEDFFEIPIKSHLNLAISQNDKIISFFLITSGWLTSTVHSHFGFTAKLQ